MDGFRVYQAYGLLPGGPSLAYEIGGKLKWTFQSLARGLRTRDAKCESGKKPALGCTTLRIGVPILLTPCGNLLARAKLNLQTIASRV